MTSFVNHRNGMIFVHNTKTGGTTINDCMIQSIDEGDEWIEYIKGHCTPEEIRIHVGDVVYDEYFSFSVMRDPYDWLISLFEYFYHVDVFSSFLPDHYSDFGLFVERFHEINQKLQSYWITNAGKLDVNELIDFSNLEQGIRKIQKRYDINKPIKKLNSKKKNNVQNHYRSQSIIDKAKKLLEPDIVLYEENFQKSAIVPKGV